MNAGSLWIIRVALTVQFLGVLSVPAIVIAAESPRGLWLAEWINPTTEPALSEWRPARREGRHESNGRTIGVLRLKDNKLTFVEQIGQVDWELDLARIKRVATARGSLLIVSQAGEEYIVSIMGPDLTPGSPKRAATTIERAIELQTSNGR